MLTLRHIKGARRIHAMIEEGRRKPHKENNMTGNIFLTLRHLYETSRKSDWPLMARIAKAQEELGEIATAGLVDEGFMTHKKLKEPFEGEVADTFICIFDSLCKRHQDKSFDQILTILADQIDLKKDKWRDIVDEQSEQLRVATHPEAE